MAIGYSYIEAKRPECNLVVTGSKTRMHTTVNKGCINVLYHATGCIHGSAGGLKDFCVRHQRKSGQV